MTRAIILAAGQGTRLRPLTDEVPKALVPLFNHPLIEHQLQVLRHAGIEDIAVVGGYRAGRLAHLPLRVFVNPGFETSNMVESLMSAADFMMEDSGEDLIVAYGDIVYEPRNLAALLAASGDISVMIDTNWRELWALRFEDPLSDAETLVLDRNRIVEIGRKPRDYSRIQGQFTGLMKFRSEVLPRLISAYQALPEETRRNMYMTDFLQVLIDSQWDVAPAKVASGWLEVDTIEDHALYHALADEERLADLFDPGTIWK